MPHAITRLLTKSETHALESRMRHMLKDMCCTLKTSPSITSSDPRDRKYMIVGIDGIPMTSHGEDEYGMDLADVAEYIAM